MPRLRPWSLGQVFTEEPDEIEEHQKLTGPDDFLRWEEFMTQRLKEDSLYDTIDGSYQRPGPNDQHPWMGESLLFWEYLDGTEDEERIRMRHNLTPLEVWEQRHGYTRDCILKALSDNIQEVVRKDSFRGTARDFWEFLQRKYKPPGRDSMLAHEALRGLQNMRYDKVQWNSVFEFRDALFSFHSTGSERNVPDSELDPPKLLHRLYSRIPWSDTAEVP